MTAEDSQVIREVHSQLAEVREKIRETQERLNLHIEAIRELHNSYAEERAEVHTLTNEELSKLLLPAGLVLLFLHETKLLNLLRETSIHELN